MARRNLRASPSGPLVDIIDPELVADGRVIYANNRTETPPDLQTGSFAAPYSTLRAAVLALTATGGAIVIAPGDYSGETIPDLGGSSAEWSLVNVDQHPNYPIGTIGPNNVVLPALNGQNINFAGCRLVGALNLTSARLNSCRVEAPITALTIDAFDSNFSAAAALTTTLGMTLYDCTIVAAVITAVAPCNVRLYDCFLGTSFTFTSPATSTLRLDQHTGAAFDAFIPTLTNVNYVVEGVSVGSARIISLTPSGALGVVDITALQPGGAVFLQPSANFNIDGFTAKQNGFWFDLVFDSNASGFIGTLNPDVGATLTSIRCPNSATFSFARNTTIRLRYQTNRWRLESIPVSPFQVAPILIGQASPFVISLAFAAGGGGAADDVAVLAANLLAFQVRVIDAWLNTITAVGGATGTLRTASGGGGTALSSAMSAAGANATSRSSLGATQTVAAAGTIFLRRSDSGFSGEVFALVTRT